MGNETSHDTEDSEQDSERSPTPQKTPPPEPYEDEPSDSRISKHIEWNFNPDEKSYSPNVKAFGLQWFAYFYF